VNLKANAEASTLKAKAWTFEAKATGPQAKDFKHMEEIKTHSTSNSLTG